MCIDYQANNKKTFEILNYNFNTLLLLKGKKPKANRGQFFGQIKLLITEMFNEPETLDEFDALFLHTMHIDDIGDFA